MKTLALLVSIASFSYPAGRAQAPPEEAPWERDLHVGMQASRSHNYPEARARLEDAAREVETLPPGAPQRSLVYHELAFVLEAIGRLDLASPLLERAVAIWESQPPRDAESRNGLAVSLSGLASLRLEQGRWNDADQAARRALPIFLEHYGPGNVHTVNCLNVLAEIRLYQERYAEAETMLLDLIPRERAAPGLRKELLSSVSSLGRMYMVSGRLQEGEAPLREAFQGAESEAGEFLFQAETATDLGTLYRLEGDAARAEPLLRKARSLYESHFPNSPGLAAADAQIAALEMSDGKFALAEQDLESGLRVLRGVKGGDTIAIAQMESSLGYAASRQGKYGRAHELMLDAIARADAFGQTSVTAAQFHGNLAEVYGREGKRGEAEKEFETAISLFERAAPRGDARLRPLLEGYAKVLKADRARKQEAREMEKRARSIPALAVR